MNTDGHKSEIDKVTEKIIGCAFTVGNRLGCGFLEKVYENALVIELPQGRSSRCSTATNGGAL
jgi:GxxExxY protein